MAGPIRGSIEHLNASAAGTGSLQGFFVNVYNFLNSNPILGIQRIAYHTGSRDTGMANARSMAFYDQPGPAGNNAFAVFRFLSASIPFDVLIQWWSASPAAPGLPAVVNGSASTTAFGIAFAQDITGVSAWNGTTNNNGMDVKGSPVWVSSSNITYYPRSNNANRTGGHGSLKQNMMGENSTISSQNARQQIVADYDNLAILWDVSIDNSYDSVIFGAYTPLSGLNASSPYFALAGALPYSPGTTYGPLAGGSPGGAISFPASTASGSCSTSIDRIGSAFFQNILSQPNRMYATQKFDEFPLIVGGFESPFQVGMAGISNFYKEVYGVSSHDTNGDGTRAAFGTTTLAAVKLTIPWHSGTVPGTGATRGGVQFGLP